uniref:Uncharacterized protein n=1 Tax=Cynoglossus semilaevis TaxID=244447 RepID=A0A3P8UN18_CYNSE
MSSVEVNDENRGVCPGGKQHNSTSNDIFVLDQPTGRPSILRQTENLPSKALPKGVKVCFQTPRRDPVTKRIVSPSKSTKMSSVEECTKALESLNLDKTHIEETVTAAVSSPAVPDTDLGSVPSCPQLSLPDEPEQKPEQKPEEPMLDFTGDFVPGTMFMTNDFDGQIDYLEQFGSSGVSICSITPTFSSYSFRDL